MQETVWTLHSTSETAWRAILNACAGARERIDIEQYLLDSFGEAEIGRELVTVLARRAGEGIKVRLLVDSVGSAPFLLSGSASFLVHSGASVASSVLPLPWRPMSFLRHIIRDHRKLVIIDGTAAFVGGVVFRESLRTWRETTLEVQGPVVSCLAESYDEMLTLATTGTLRTKFISPSHRAVSDGFEMVRNAPGWHKRHIRHELVAHIRGARQNVRITVPYFSPDQQLRRALMRAARRGVSVDVLLPEHSDRILADWAARSHFGQLLRAGVHLHLYHGGLHAKTVTVDRQWATVGSANLDPLSMYYNYELNLNVHREDVVTALDAQFETDLGHAEHVDRAAWRCVSVFRRLWYRVVGRMLRAIV